MPFWEYEYELNQTQQAWKIEKESAYPVLWIICPRVATATSLLLAALPSNRASTTTGISSGRYCLIAKPPYDAENCHNWDQAG